MSANTDALDRLRALPPEIAQNLLERARALIEICDAAGAPEEAKRTLLRSALDRTLMLHRAGAKP